MSCDVTMAAGITSQHTEDKATTMNLEMVSHSTSWTSKAPSSTRSDDSIGSPVSSLGDRMVHRGGGADSCCTQGTCSVTKLHLDFVMK